jgi:hypothetical protein
LAKIRQNDNSNSQKQIITSKFKKNPIFRRFSQTKVEVLKEITNYIYVISWNENISVTVIATVATATNGIKHTLCPTTTEFRI